MLERALKTISRYNMLPQGIRVAAAVSGGADSVCLAHFLREIGANLTGIAHFNHRLRGEASDRDERFAAELAQSFGLPFYRAEADVAAVRGNIEEAARHARRRFFQQLMRDGACDKIALGHTHDDQAETVLFRMLRGSGLSGLAGIHPVTPDGLVRPLIEASHEDCEKYLRSRGTSWREDATNRDRRFARNRIRHDLLPQLAREWNPQIHQALAHLADLAYEEERWWSGALPDLLIETSGGIELRASALAALPRAVARRLVRQAIAQVKGDLRRVEFDHVERVIALAHSASRAALPGIEAVRSFDWIRIGEPWVNTAAPVAVTIPGTYPAPDGAGEIRVEIDETHLEACVTLKVKLTAPMELRGWRPGDHYRPVGKSRDQKIKEMFQTARIPSWRRHGWPVLQAGGEIVWARSFGPAAGAELKIGAGLKVSESR
ncbi:MAG: tRNA lysidine(34) synthetase TilS [Bryobacteraceae bacterium]